MQTYRILVNAPSGMQEIVTVAESGLYFDSARILWDERADGELPDVTLGKMQRNGDQLTMLDDYLPEHAAASIPHEITMRQAELALGESGYLSAVEAWVESVGEDLKSYWRRSTTIKRDHQYVEDARIELGLTKEQMDQLFILADTKEK